ncbi:polyprenyl synthetase family protein [Holospora curviuscula]|uniref:(2E,6E)-farnesyl diphosphate synthase n=1 Tax=Holospora curviuscula TaxID=1082868 RepID=A0A2S5R6U4_9PROT|nr:polyprenyl synthetase family protein [Holospora curviuscula]PPE03020.1 (2E,6E)-farnesyl diphosphate synthase [Holospora curviuscula]
MCRETVQVQHYIDKALLRMRLELFQEVHLGCSELSPLLSDALWPAGKALRPKLGLTIAFLFSQDPLEHPEIMALCKAIECVHMASLLHDDVLDLGETRRYRPCFYHAWGQRKAILLGDYLLSIALRYLVDANHIGLLSIIQRAVTEMTRGQIQEELMSWSQGIEEYEQIALQKTASLFSATAKAVCEIFCIQDSRAILLESYGKSVGFCYQLQDDLQDYMSTRKDKQRFQDFFQSRITAPLLWLRERVSLETQYTIKTWWNRPTLEHAHHIYELMVYHNIPCYGRKKIQEHKISIYEQLQEYWLLESIDPLMQFFSFS